MTIASYPDDHPPYPRHAKTGVLLVNVGSPDATDFWSVRRYLKQFLSDPRMIEVPRLVWWFVLNGIILNTRPAKSGRAYAKIWLENDPDGSPLKKYTRDQARELAEMMPKRGWDPEKFYLTWAMRYASPSLPEKLDELREMGCNRLLIMPLYPQYAAATTASVQDEVFHWMKHQRWQPAIRTIAPWHDHPQYIDALAGQVKNAIKDDPHDALLVSFHGIPKRYFLQGDPYHCHSMKTARLLRGALAWPSETFHVSFQSRVGREPWLKPYTDETIKDLARAGVKRLAVIAPGFSVDCVETLEELAIEGRDHFLAFGGETLTYIPCLNASPPAIELLATLLQENIGGWL